MWLVHQTIPVATPAKFGGHKTSLKRNPTPYLRHPDLPPVNVILHQLDDALNHSWSSYVKFAWGMDEVNVLKQTGTIWMNSALTMVDSLDTLWMYGMKKEFSDARDYIAEWVDFDLDDDHVNVFESTIRLLGGLLSAHHLSKDKVFLKKAVNLICII